MLQHAFKRLGAREDIETKANKQKWASREACNAEALHKSGSYINLLILKLDSIVANELSTILNAVDRYSNLNLLQSESYAISSLWLKIFKDPEIILDLKKLKDTGFDHSYAIFASFKCNFPFFWLFINSIEEQWKNSPLNGKQ